MKRVWQKYIGTPETIERVYDEYENCTSTKFKSFEYGRTAALMKVAEELEFLEIVNKHTNKKKIDGLTVGEYMLLIMVRDLLEPYIDEKRADVVKGIGWGLKTIGRKHPCLLIEFLEKQLKAKKKISKLMMKKSTTYLSKDQRMKVDKLFNVQKPNI